MIALPDAAFSAKVEALYKHFKQSYDNTLFKGQSPIYVVGVFDYANEMEDPDTMFHLFHRDYRHYSEQGIGQ